MRERRVVGFVSFVVVLVSLFVHSHCIAGSYRISFLLDPSVRDSEFGAYLK